MVLFPCSLRLCEPGFMLLYGVILQFSSWINTCVSSISHCIFSIFRRVQYVLHHINIFHTWENSRLSYARAIRCPLNTWYLYGSSHLSRITSCDFPSRFSQHACIMVYPFSTDYGIPHFAQLRYTPFSTNLPKVYFSQVNRFYSPRLSIMTYQTFIHDDDLTTAVVLQIYLQIWKVSFFFKMYSGWTM